MRSHDVDHAPCRVGAGAAAAGETAAGVEVTVDEADRSAPRQHSDLAPATVAALPGLKAPYERRVRGLRTAPDRSGHRRDHDMTACPAGPRRPAHRRRRCPPRPLAPARIPGCGPCKGDRPHHRRSTGIAPGKCSPRDPRSDSRRHLLARSRGRGARMPASAPLLARVGERHRGRDLPVPRALRSPAGCVDPAPARMPAMRVRPC